ncbi:hypothetical protein DFH94DRAFT_234896 [Russula ochroleuca]|uniref:Uncharacterized protein n=1 Tax=Russula ochroleuca TaxID=152965 RepID=A0A9P5TCF4_9AGAM|nr:hypothetical protein DFH94DRAFT_234896 [Russula ochroleuca]
MPADSVLAEQIPASQPAVPRRGAGAMRTGQPHTYDAAGLEASTRQTGASNDSSPSSPFPSGTKVKNDSFGSATVYRHRQTNNVERSSDNRKIAIVPLKVDTPGPARGDETAQYIPSVPNATTTTLPPPLAGRRELLVGAQLAASGPALVAPADTTNLVRLQDVPSSPSSSASLSPTTPKFPHSPSSSSEQEKSRTRRSIAHPRSPRDVGIVGTLTRRELPPQDLTTVQDPASDYQPPIFQTPSSRSSSPDTSSVDTTSPESNPRLRTASSGEAHPHSAHSLNTSLPRPQLVDPPEQGQASPVAASSVSTAPSSYVHYQPGVHSKAGPLPPPPRAMFDIDFNAPPPPRPPRLRSPSPLNSQKAPGGGTPPSVTVRLAAKPSTASIHQIHISATPPLSTQSSSSEESDYSPDSEPGPTCPVRHAREGAFPPSTILATPAERNHSLPDKSIRLVPEVPSKDQLPDPPTDILDSTPAITVQPAKDAPSPSTARSPELRRESSWISNSNDSSHISSESSRHAFEDARPQEGGSYSSTRDSATEDSPSEPKRKGGILTNLKRYSSLPRPPSMRSQRLSIFTRTPPPPKPRIRARSPDAMRCKDILNKRSALERATAYAHKINELSMYDCGLGDWVTSTKEKGSSKTRLVPISPSQSPDSDLDPRPRHTSRASISSEMTFPLRADAYIATDLSQRDIDTVPSPNVPPPALPYPALAGVSSTVNSRHSATTMGAQLSHATSLSMGSKVTGAFFSHLGRSSSTRKDVSKPAQPTRSTKQSLTAPNPRPVQIISAPSVPGGPRALPGRVQRSQTLMLSSSPPNSGNASASLPMRRRSNTLKRPSFFGRSPNPSPEVDVPTSTDFTRQVDRLADLLPHADKDVLAGYLNRAGQDILAIGQYLEDERNGTVRRH